MQLALGRVTLENPVNHKLRVLVRVDVDPAHVTLEITGCLTQSDFSRPAAHRAPRLPPRSRAPTWSSTSTAPPTWTLRCCWTSGVSLMPDALPAPGCRGLRRGRAASASPSTSRRSCRSACCTSAPTAKSSPDSTATTARPRSPSPGTETAKLPDCSTSGPAPDPTPGWGRPTARWPRKPAAPATLAPSTAWRSPSTSRERWILCRHGPGTVRHGAVPAGRRSLPPPRHQQPVFRRAHLVRAGGRRAAEPPPASMTVTRRGRTGRRARPWPEPGRG